MGTLVCKIELDKVKGATVTIENADGKITQTVTMDGTTLTMKVAGQQSTSTYVQQQDTVHITVDNFILEAKTIKVTSSKESTWKSDDGSADPDETHRYFAKW